MKKFFVTITAIMFFGYINAQILVTSSNHLYIKNASYIFFKNSSNNVSGRISFCLSNGVTFAEIAPFSFNNNFKLTFRTTGDNSLLLDGTGNTIVDGGNLTLKAINSNPPGSIKFAKADTTMIAKIYADPVVNKLYVSTLTNAPTLTINESGNIGICGAPYSTCGLTVGSSSNYANTYFFSDAIEFYHPYSMRLTIDNTGDHGKSVHPVTNNQCNVGNSNKAFEYMWSYHFSNPSDARQKENIRDIPDALDKVLALKGVKYDIKKEYSYNDLTIKDAKIKSGLEARRKNQVGFIAQDIYKVLPEAVVYDDSTDVYGIDYCKIVPVLVEAIKELKTQVDSLKL